MGRQEEGQCLQESPGISRETKARALEKTKDWCAELQQTLSRQMAGWMKKNPVSLTSGYTSSSFNKCTSRKVQKQKRSLKEKAIVRAIFRYGTDLGIFGLGNIKSYNKAPNEKLRNMKGQIK